MKKFDQNIFTYLGATNTLASKKLVKFLENFTNNIFDERMSILFDKDSIYQMLSGKDRLVWNGGKKILSNLQKIRLNMRGAVNLNIQLISIDEYFSNCDWDLKVFDIGKINYSNAGTISFNITGQGKVSNVIEIIDLQKIKALLRLA